MNIAEERCFNHAGREAAARCPACRRYFCRECVSEHEGRVICAVCLHRLSAKPAKHNRLLGVLWAAQILAGILILWSSFYLLGRALLAIPASFHDQAFRQEESKNK